MYTWKFSIYVYMENEKHNKASIQKILTFDGWQNENAVKDESTEEEMWNKIKKN